MNFQISAHETTAAWNIHGGSFEVHENDFRFQEYLPSPNVNDNYDTLDSSFGEIGQSHVYDCILDKSKTSCIIVGKDYCSKETLDAIDIDNFSSIDELATTLAGI